MFRMELFYLFCFVMLVLYLKEKTKPREVFLCLWRPYLVICGIWFFLVMLLGVLPVGQSGANGVTHALFEQLEEMFWVTQQSAFGAPWTGHTLVSLFPAVFFTWWEARLLKTWVRDRWAQFGFALLLGVLSYVSMSFFMIPYALQDSLMLLPLWLMCERFYEHPRIPLKWDALLLLIVLFPLYRVWVPKNWMIFGHAARWFWRAALTLFVTDIWKKTRDWELSSWFMDHSILLFGALSCALGSYTLVAEWTGTETWSLPDGASSLGILIQLAVTALLLAGVLLMRKLRAKLAMGIPIRENGRRTRIDLFRGILMILVIAGHFMTDRHFWNVIYSFHMPAFLMISGYFYHKEEKPLYSKAAHLAKKLLVPYVLCALLYLLFDLGAIRYTGIWPDIRMFLLGLSFATPLFSGVPQAGPVYFLLMLFVTKMIYLLLDSWAKNSRTRIAAVLILSCAGYLIGQRQYWLPWSFDLALYSLAFYEAGVQMRRHQVLRTLRDHPLWILMLAAVWVFMIHFGSMELATRKLSPYGLVLAGAFSGTCVVYLLCCGISRDLPAFLLKPLTALGRYSVIALIFHTLLRERFTAWMAALAGEGTFLWYVMTILSQVICVLILAVCAQAVSGMFQKRRKKKA